MDYYGNDQRKNRCDDLIAMMNSSQLDMNRRQKIFEAKTDFYQDIVNRAARLHGYPSIEALEQDMMELMETVDKSDVLAFKEAAAGLSTMHKTVGSLSLVVFASGVVGQVRMKVKYGKNILPWNRFNKANEMKVLRNCLLQRLSVGAPRELKVKRALGLIDDVTFEDRMGKLAKAAYVVKVTDAAEFSKGGKYANTPAALGAAKTLKRTSRFLTFLEVAGWIAEIAAIIADVVTGAVLKDKLQGAIKELSAQRFLTKKLEMLGVVYDTFNEQVNQAVGVWVKNQESLNAGNKCYLEGDTALNTALGEAYVAMEKDMIGVCDCAVLDACRADDTTYGSWTNEDPSYAEMMQYLQETYPDMTFPPCNIHHPTPSNPAPSDSDYTEDGIYPNVLTGSKVNATNCRYVELTNGKGCLWRIRGGFWTVQQPFDTDSSAEPNGLKGPRIQFLERRRTDTKIYLQNITNWQWNNDVNVKNWVPPAGVPLLPWIVIDFSSKTLKTLPGTTNVSQPGEGANWGTRTLEPASYCNLTQINGWTLFYAPPTAASNESKTTKLINSHECNQAKGWEFSYVDTKDAKTFEQLVERSRTKDRINMETKLVVFEEGDPPYGFPKGYVDVANNKIVRQSLNANTGATVTREFALDRDAWKARTNFT